MKLRFINEKIKTSQTILNAVKPATNATFKRHETLNKYKTRLMSRAVILADPFPIQETGTTSLSSLRLLGIAILNAPAIALNGHPVMREWYLAASLNIT